MGSKIGKFSKKMKCRKEKAGQGILQSASIRALSKRLFTSFQNFLSKLDYLFFKKKLSSKYWRSNFHEKNFLEKNVSASYLNKMDSDLFDIELIESVSISAFI